MKPYTSKILSGLAIAGVFGTAATTAIATKKAVKKLLESYDDNYLYEDRVKDPKEKIKLIWKYYIIPATIAGGTIGCIITADHANTKVIAGMSASIALLKKSYDKYKIAAKHVFGEEGEKAIRKEVVNMHDKKPLDIIENDDREVYWIGYGYDDYFRATPEEIALAEAELNKRLHKGEAISVADVMDSLNLSPSEESVGMGWSLLELSQADDDWIEFTFNTIDTDGDHPCQEIDFSCHPSMDFEEHQKLYVRGEPIDRSMPIDDEPPFDLV